MKSRLGASKLLGAACFALISGLMVSAQSVSVTPTSLSFGSQPLGIKSAAKQVTLKNGQKKALTITSVASTLSDFVIGNTCPLSPNTLGAGKSCTISVSFTPGGPGTRSGLLKITDNANNGVQSVSLSGTGVASTLVSIAVTPATASIPLGQKQQFAATGTYSDNSTQNLTSTASWTSSAIAVATVSSGLATSVGQGSTSITATVGAISGTASLTVAGPTLVSIAVAPATASIPLGQKQQFAATGTYSDNSTQNLTSTASWTSSATAVATVSSGLVTSVGQGSTSIKATVGAISGTASLTVAAPTLVSIAVTPATASIPLGQKQQFAATGTYSDNSTQNLTSTASWTSSATAVATVSSGLATSVGQGSTSIKATVGAISGTASLTITAPTLVSIAVIPATASIPLGQKQQFAATGTYSDGSTQNLTSTASWTSSATAVATVSSGLATSVGQGSTSITATVGAISGTTSLTVTAQTLVSIAVTPATAPIPLGQKQQFAATGTYSDNSTQNLTSTASWTSSAIAVATVSSGLATSVGQGSTSITATVGLISGTASLTVAAPTLVSIAVTPPTAAIPLGQKQQFAATGTYSDGSTQDVTNPASWSSSDTSIGTIISPGLVSSIAIGNIEITATVNQTSGTASLNVGQPVLVSIAVTPENPAFALGSTQQLKATGTYSDGSTLDLTNAVTWSSANAGVATVDVNGLVTSVSAGSGSVQAAVGATSGATTVTITPATLVSVTITPAIPSISSGTTQQFLATGTYTDGSTQNISNTVAWSSDATNIATISNDSGSQGLAKGVATGTANISATSGSVSSTTTLTVSAAQLVSIAISPENPVLALGTKQQLTATGSFTDGSTQDLTAAVTWSSDTISTATISPTGLVTSIAVGTAGISATSGQVVGATGSTVTAAELVSIDVSPPTAVLPLGLTQQFVARGTFTDGSTQDLTQSGHWVSSLASVATISDSPGSQGLATTLGTGSTTITINAGTVSGSATLQITAAALVSIAINPGTPTIALGNGQQFTASGTYTDGTTQDISSSVLWSSSSVLVAVISNNPGTVGLATSAGTGTTTITATFGSVSSSTALTVSQAQLQSIAVTPVNASVPLGFTQTFLATGTNTDGTTQDLTQSAAWSSSPPGVVTFNSPGIASTSFLGNAIITATLNSVSGGSQFTVTTPVAMSLLVTPATTALSWSGQQQFTATLVYSDGSSQNVTTAVSWSSSTPQVAAIGSTGLATGLSGGSTVIQAAWGGLTLVNYAQLTVSPPALVSIAVTPGSVSIALSGTLQFTATGTFADGSTQNLTSTVNWSSSNSVVASVAGSGLGTAMGFGTATIRATSGSISNSATVTVPTVATVPASFFDMHLNKQTTPWPTDSFSGERLSTTRTRWLDLETCDGKSDPTSACYNWKQLDAWVNTALSHGVDLLYPIYATPSWASSNPTDATCNPAGSCDPPSDLYSDGTGANKYFKDFVTAMATHLGPKVTYWETWNEVNVKSYWKGTNAQLVRMAQDLRCIVAGTGSVSGFTCGATPINPNAIFLTPSTVPSGSGFTAQGLQNYLSTSGAGAAADVFNVHGYIQCPTGCTAGVVPIPENIVTYLNNVKTVMGSSYPAKPLWIDEGGWGVTTVDLFNDQDVRAAFLARYLLLQITSGVSRFYWFEWDGGTSGAGTLWDTVNTNVAGCNNTGVPNNGGYICQAGIAYQQVQNWVVGAVLTNCSSSGTIWTCNLTRSGGYVGQVVWDTSQSCSGGVCSASTYVPSSQFVKYRDLSGTQYSIAGSTVQIGAKPIILENQ